MALDRKLFLEAEKLSDWRLLIKADDANLNEEYRQAAVFAAAALSRSGLTVYFRYPQLINAYFAERKLGDRVVAERAGRQFDEIASVPREIWRAQWASAMHDTRVFLGDAKPDDPIRYPMPEPYTPPVGDGFWQTGDPAKMGWKEPAIQALKEHVKLCQETGADGCLVVYRGKIVSEWQSPRYFWPMFAMSSTKSITGLLTGMARGDGKIDSVDDPVGKYLSEWREGRRGRATVRHVLTMTSGLGEITEDEWEKFWEDHNTFVLNKTPKDEPGEKWEYSNVGVQLLSPLLDRALGEPVQDYAAQRLFEPLGMDETELYVNRHGNAITYADCMTTCRDMARLGLLMLHDGRWQGKQIVPADWVRESVQPCKHKDDYGYLWWLYERPKGFAMLGYLHNDCYCFPQKDLVIVRMQWSSYLFEKGVYGDRALKLFERMGSD
jgi:hypothetical protein